LYNIINSTTGNEYHLDTTGIPQDYYLDTTGIPQDYYLDTKGMDSTVLPMCLGETLKLIMVSPQGSPFNPFGPQ